MLGERPVTIRTPLQHQDKMPDSVDVAIIGGGIIGIFAALYLARSGKKVIVLEKGRVAGEQSSRNWGWVRQQGRDLDEFPIVVEAKRLWGEVDRQTKGEIGYVQSAITYLASTQKEANRLAQWLEASDDFKAESRMLSRRELAGLIDRRVTGMGHEWVGALHTASDGRAEPWKAVPLVAELASQDGALIRENCAVRALDIAAGKLTGVITEDGTIKCEQVVLCAGAWSSLFLRRHGYNIPQLMVRSNVAQTGPMPQFIAGAAADEKFAFRRRQDGGYTLAMHGTDEHLIGPDSFRNFAAFLRTYFSNASYVKLRPWTPSGYPDAWTTPRKWAEDEVTPFEKMRVLDPSPNPKAISQMRKSFAACFPALGEPDIIHAWAGMIDTMPDIVPVVDRHPELDGLIVATGMAGHGFGIGPGFGKIIAEMANGLKPRHNLHRFRYKRFMDGSVMDAGVQI